MIKLLFSLAIVTLAILFTPYFGYTDKVTLFLAEFYSEHLAAYDPSKPNIKLMHQAVALPVKPLQAEGEQPQSAENNAVQNSEPKK